MLLLSPVAFANHAQSTQKKENAMQYLEKNLGRRVSVTGVAKDAKLGAVVWIDGDVVYIAGKESWEASLLDKKVRVKGVVRKFEPPVAKNENGARSAGVSEKEILYKLEQAEVKEIKQE